MRTVKDEIRVLGIDDGPFDFDDETAALIGTVFRGGSYLEAVLKDAIAVDGEDVTDTIISMVTEGRHSDQIQAVLLDGITFAGFNVADINRIAADASVAVIAVSRRMPDRDRMRDAMSHVDQPERRMQLVEEAGTPICHELPDGDIYFQCAGISGEQAREVLDVVTVRGVLPEPVRVSHLIASAFVDGESKGRA